MSCTTAQMLQSHGSFTLYVWSGRGGSSCCSRSMVPSSSLIRGRESAAKFRFFLIDSSEEGLVRLSKAWQVPSSSLISGRESAAKFRFFLEDGGE